VARRATPKLPPTWRMELKAALARPISTGRIVAKAATERVALHELPLDELRALSPLFEPDFREAVSVEASLAARNVYGGTGPKAVLQELAEARALLETP